MVVQGWLSASGQKADAPMGGVVAFFWLSSHSLMRSDMGGTARACSGRCRRSPDADRASGTGSPAQLTNSCGSSSRSSRSAPPSNQCPLDLHRSKRLQNDWGSDARRQRVFFAAPGLDDSDLTREATEPHSRLNNKPAKQRRGFGRSIQAGTHLSGYHFSECYLQL